MDIRFLSLGSSSEGNSYFFGTPDYGILIDAGLTYKKLSTTLISNHIPFASIWGCFITHSHRDHCQAANLLFAHHNIPIFATSDTAKTLHLPARIVSPDEQIPVRDFLITPIPLPHDAPCVGYNISIADTTILVATDFGKVSPAFSDSLSNADYVIVESNYDEDLIAVSKYPEALKSRIQSAEGHISNRTLHDALKEHSHARQTFVGHLSLNNNSPDRAAASLADIPAVTILPRYASPMFTLSCTQSACPTT